MTESRSQRRRAVMEAAAPRPRVSPLGFALAGYRVGTDLVQVGEVYETPAEAEEAARRAGGVASTHRAFVVALTPVAEIGAASE